jgi:hypothetical protein
MCMTRLPGCWVKNAPGTLHISNAWLTSRVLVLPCVRSDLDPRTMNADLVAKLEAYRKARAFDAEAWVDAKWYVVLFAVPIVATACADTAPIALALTR